MEDGDQSAPMNLEEANDRTLNLVLEGGEDTLRRASAANLKVFQILMFNYFYYLIIICIIFFNTICYLKGTSDRTNNLLTRKETMRALKDRTTAVRRRNTMRQASQSLNPSISCVQSCTAKDGFKVA